MLSTFSYIIFHRICLQLIIRDKNESLPSQWCFSHDRKNNINDNLTKIKLVNIASLTEHKNTVIQQLQQQLLQIISNSDADSLGHGAIGSVCVLEEGYKVRPVPSYTDICRAFRLESKISRRIHLYYLGK